VHHGGKKFQKPKPQGKKRERTAGKKKPLVPKKKANTPPNGFSDATCPGRDKKQRGQKGGELSEETNNNIKRREKKKKINTQRVCRTQVKNSTPCAIGNRKGRHF